jgi:excisionase family DNA binding protein
LKKTVQPDEWISQSEAARVRGISRSALHDLVKRGRLRTLEIAGKVLVERAQVEAFIPLVGGRPRKKASGAKPLARERADKGV